MHLTLQAVSGRPNQIRLELLNMQEFYCGKAKRLHSQQLRHLGLKSWLEFLGLQLLVDLVKQLHPTLCRRYIRFLDQPYWKTYLERTGDLCRQLGICLNNFNVYSQGFALACRMEMF